MPIYKKGTIRVVLATIFILSISIASASGNNHLIGGSDHLIPNQYHFENQNNEYYTKCDFFDYQDIDSSCYPDIALAWKDKLAKLSPTNSRIHQSYNNVIQPILFVPKDLYYDNSHIKAINETTSVIASWYAGQLSGATFSYTQAQTVIGLKNLKEYCPSSISDTQCIKTVGDGQATGQEGTWEVIADLAQQGYEVRPGIIYIIYWVGGYGRAVGARFSSDSGFALVADWALDGILGKYETNTAPGGCSDSSFTGLCNKNTQIGAIAHELGHAFGLPHPSDDGTTTDHPDYWWHSVMQSFWEFPTSILLNSSVNPEKATLLAHPYIRSIDIHKKVVPIIFIPRDQPTDLNYISQVEKGFSNVQQWYQNQLLDKKFRFVSPHIIVGKHKINYYCSYSTNPYQCIKSTNDSGIQPENVNLVLSDMQNQGYELNENTIFIIFWVGSYNYAEGQQATPSSGYAILGDWALDGLAGKYEAGTATSRCSDSPYAQFFCNKNAQLGTLAQLLGLTFGLQPSKDDGTTEGDPNYWRSSIMQFFWEYPDVKLLNSIVNPEKDIISRHPLFYPTYNIFLPLTTR